MPNLQRLDPTKDEDLTTLVKTGLIWQASVPADYKRLAVEAIATGRIDPAPGIPPDALAEIARQRDNAGLPPLDGPQPVAASAAVEPLPTAADPADVTAVPQ